MKDTVKARRARMLEVPINLCYPPYVSTQRMGRRRALMSPPSLHGRRLLIGVLLLFTVIPGALWASPLDQLTDLSGKATVSVTLTSRDNFNSEYRYDLIVRNRSSDPLIGESLIVVLEKITNLAGEDREPLKS